MGTEVTSFLIASIIHFVDHKEGQRKAAAAAAATEKHKPIFFFKLINAAFLNEELDGPFRLAGKQQ
jgi:hypothetical protein